MKTTTTESSPTPVTIPDRTFFRIGDVADLAGVKPYVLRYWESEFPMIAPTKSNSGHRVYRRGDVETVLLIKHLLYTERYSIEGARKRIRDLRKGGDLKAAKQERVVKAAEAKPVTSPEAKASLAEIKTIARELRAMAREPISKLFSA